MIGALVVFVYMLIGIIFVFTGIKYVEPEAEDWKRARISRYVLLTLTWILWVPCAMIIAIYERYFQC